MSSPVQLVDISRGAEFTIHLAAFAERAPLFAYVDDVGSAVEPGRGVALAGRLTIHDQPPYMWLEGPRDCLLLKPTDVGVAEGRITFRSLGVGEFCLELYYVRPDMSAALIGRADFCFK